MMLVDAPEKPENQNSGSKVRLLIADDHALLRRGLIELLRGVYPDWEFLQAETLEETTGMLETHSVTLLILDLKMPGMNSVSTVHALRSKYPSLNVTILTGSDDRAMILQCLSAGVHGYILKSAASEQLIQAVETILAGGIYVPPLLSHVPHEDEAVPVVRESAVISPNLPMTGRQLEVLKLLAEGRCTKDIARTLGLGIGTVKVHLAGVYRALGAHSRMEAVVKAGKFRD
jgi:DNA-binding NarL/FixJ family response regulator